VKRPLADFDWNVRACGRQGHVTYRPDEPDLAQRLSVDTALGEAWRCLRCGDFVVGTPHGNGPADEAPLVLRGKALQDAFILRLLAVERGVRGLLLLVLAFGIYKFEGAKNSLNRVFQEDLPLLRPVADRLGVDLQDSGPVKLVQKALDTSHGTLELVALGVLAYAVLELLEAVGLWLMKRWGEYVAVVGTGIFVPLEVYELVEKVTWLRVLAFVVNVFAVVYIVWTKRLFAFRGGHAAFEAERQSESLLEIEASAPEREKEPRATQARD
jgi:uncharacterized membrane protein (DUF2068 family)